MHRQLPDQDVDHRCQSQIESVAKIGKTGVFAVVCNDAGSTNTPQHLHRIKSEKSFHRFPKQAHQQTAPENWQEGQPYFQEPISNLVESEAVRIITTVVVSAGAKNRESRTEMIGSGSAISMAISEGKSQNSRTKAKDDRHYPEGSHRHAYK
mmetsp:Transcript_11235/g.23843  ORF Transcript_11235/g.23843 Transcript_11235/m.23843 type:complete len:152 (-) Transcript_11235:504-959(-)